MHSVCRIPPLLSVVAVTLVSAVVVACTGSAPTEPHATVMSATAPTRQAASPPPVSEDPRGPLAGADPRWVHVKIELDELRRAADVPVFFGHQSVGGNVLKGVAALFEEWGLPAPPLIDIEGKAVPAEGGYVAHVHVGRNGDPLGKLVRFDEILRRGTMTEVEVALLKFCYADVKEHTDTQVLFREYQKTLSLLEHRLPDVVFLHATVPLTVDDPEDNAARMTYNSLMREVYADSGRLWDLAAIESTTLDGQRLGGTVSGHEFEALHPAYSTDGGHLNDQGARLAAAALLRLVAQHAEN